MAWRVSPARLCRQLEHTFWDLPRRASPVWHTSTATRPQRCRPLRAAPLSSSSRTRQDAGPAEDNLKARPVATKSAAGRTPVGASTSEVVKPEAPGTSKRPHRKKRGAAIKAPLAKIAKDAEVSHLRGLVHGPSRGRDAKVKRVTAFCVAEEYDLAAAQELLQKHGIPIGPSGAILYPEEPQVIHVELTYPSEFHSHAPDARSGFRQGDIFVFPLGVVVSWGVPRAHVSGLIEKLRPAARGELGGIADTEDLEYVEDESEDTSAVRNEQIVLGTKATQGGGPDGADPAQHPSSNMRTVLAKIAFSSGLARATRVSVLENQVDDYIESTRFMLHALRRGRSWRLQSRRAVYGAMARLLELRAQLNLYSELTDLPDLLWESRPELRMETYYDQVGRALDTAARIRSLNQRMDYSASIVHALRDMRSEGHSSSLEITIIILISLEIMLTLWLEYRAAQREQPGASQKTKQESLKKDL